MCLCLQFYYFSLKHAILYHKLCNSQHAESLGEVQELQSGSLPISRLEILDGDEIIIDESKKIPSTRLEYHLINLHPDIEQSTE